MNQQNYFTVAEAADYLRKGAAAMRAHANTQDPAEHIPASRDGRRLIFARTDLDAYMDRKKETA